MPSRVGHVSKVYEDGHVRVRDEMTGEEHFGRLVIGSGGMVMFGAIDERRITVGSEGVRKENAAPSPVKTRVKVAD